tara:strand:- start:77 stop:376 length:300 start_codon:yes stop_codon:yes gene_type:complete
VSLALVEGVFIARKLCGMMGVITKEGWSFNPVSASHSSADVTNLLGMVVLLLALWRHAGCASWFTKTPIRQVDQTIKKAAAASAGRPLHFSCIYFAPAS